MIPLPLLAQVDPAWLNLGVVIMFGMISGTFALSIVTLGFVVRVNTRLAVHDEKLEHVEEKADQAIDHASEIFKRLSAAERDIATRPQRRTN